MAGTEPAANGAGVSRRSGHSRRAGRDARGSTRGPAELKPDVGDNSHASAEGSGPSSAVRRVVPEYLTIGTILGAWGLNGEMKVRIETDFPSRFQGLGHVYLGREHTLYEVEGFRPYRGMGLLKLKGIDAPESIGELRLAEVQIPASAAVLLPKGQFYVHQIEGLEVRTESGELLGTVAEVLLTGANAVLVVRGPRGEVLIPKIEGVVQRIDLDAGCITVRLLPGLLD